MFTTGRLPAFGEQVRDTLVYVAHPLRLLGGGGSIDCEGFGRRLDEPPIPQLPFILDGVDGDVFQGNNVLLVVFFLLDDNVAIYKNIIKQEKLPCFGLLSAELSQYSLSNKYTSRDG